MKSVKLHNPLLDAVRNGLTNIFNNGSYADKEVQKLLKSNRQFGSKDRAFIAETIYDIVRNIKNYQHFINRDFDTSTVLSSFDNLILISLLNRESEITNPELLEISVDESDIKNEAVNMSAAFSFPDWIHQRCTSECGEQWNTIASALNKPARIYVRANTLRTNTKKLTELFAKENVNVSACSPITSDPFILAAAKNCIEIVSKNNLKNSWLYKEGLFEFQDIGSQVIAEFCSVKEKQIALDLCAGGGGKSLHLSALMKNTGKIYATDIHTHRMENLYSRAKQAGAKNIEILLYENVHKLNNIDVLLIDAPCSGLGTIRRHPDLKWKLKPEDIDKYISVQSALLEKFHHLIGEKGKIIYATCSILPSEGEHPVKNFLNAHRDFSLEKELRIHPHQLDNDGFYMAEIKRKD